MQLIKALELMLHMYMDISKAFDFVPHQKLFQKLATYGFGGKLLLWFKGFLSDHYQRVALLCNGCVIAINED